jgi:tetratricopeptide (TPR) repeat protein
VGEPLPPRYLGSLSAAQRALLERVNDAGLAALHGYLAGGHAVAFLGAGASTPLYPLWTDVIGELVDQASARLDPQAAATCQALAAGHPEAVVELLRRQLGAPEYRQVLREVFRIRRDPATGRTWTPTHELVARCAFEAVVTTNYDPGILDVRMKVRPRASGTGFATWADEDAMDRWRTGEVFGDDELPVLFAHGHHNRPEDVVLATTEYRRAYAGKLARVLAQLIDTRHVVWVGFSFADQRIAAVLREVTGSAGTCTDPGGPARHVALLPWDPAATAAGGGVASNDPQVLATVAEIEYGCRLVLYPAPDGDHSALQELLGEFIDPRFPPTPDTGRRADPVGAALGGAAGGAGGATARGGTAPGAGGGAAGAAVPHGGAAGARSRDGAPAARVVPAARPGTPAVSPPAGLGQGPVVRWVHGGTPVDHFTGRVDELARLDRWAADPQVRLVGVTAWGGAGKTALVTEWLTRDPGRAGPGACRPVGPGACRPVGALFAWSFYEDRSAEAWARALLDWAEREFGLPAGSGSLAARVLALAHAVPLLLVLDGLEVLQEGPAGARFGRLLDGVLRDVLTGWCQLGHAGLAVLTSRFPFADLEGYDGVAARMLEVPPLTVGEGAELLAASGAGWVSDADRRSLADAVDGHALALTVLAAGLATVVGADVAALREELVGAGRTGARVGKVLAFYADRLGSADRLLVALVALFQRPVPVATVLTLGTSATLGAPLAGWTEAAVATAVGLRLAGLLAWHPDRTVSAHPLVRDAFRPLVLSGDSATLASDASLAGLPAGPVASREDALRVVEMVELLLDAGQWVPADQLYQARAGGRPVVWQTLPAARLGQRAATAFVATPTRRDTCRTQLLEPRLSDYLNAAGLCGMVAGDLASALDYLQTGADLYRAQGDRANLATALRNLSVCYGYLGDGGQAHAAAAEALALRRQILSSHACLGAALDLAGDIAGAQAAFIAADTLEVTGHPLGDHLYSGRGVWWGEFLARTGRTRPARTLTERNRQICERRGWKDDVARCDRLLARLDLLPGGHARAACAGLEAAVRTFRDGDLLVEWAATLPDLAEHVRRGGDLGHAEALCAQAVAAAGPRGLVPAHARALAVRAVVRADRYLGGDPGHLVHARDDAELALRLATRVRHLPWTELDALAAHAHIDGVEGCDHGWQARADTLRTTLVPPGLDPDPAGHRRTAGRAEETAGRPIEETAGPAEETEGPTKETAEEGEEEEVEVVGRSHREVDRL